MKTLILILISICAFAQKDTTITTKKVIVIDSIYYVQTTSSSIYHQKLDAQLLQKVESIEQEKARKVEENTKNESERKELVKLVQEAIKKGYKPKSDNSNDDATYNRILTKIKKEKL